MGLALSLLPIVAAAAPGDVDLDFGSGGQVELPFFTARGVGVDARNRILAAGYDYRPITEFNVTQAIVVARYDPAGAADPTFGEGGVARIDDAHREQRYGAFTVQPDGRSLVAFMRRTDTGIDEQLVLVRLDTDGRVDPAFADGTGELIAPATDGLGFDQPQILLHDDGRITVTARVCIAEACGVFLVRADRDGSIFGTTPVFEGLQGIVGGPLALTRDEQFVLAARLSEADAFPVALVRFDEFATPDLGFGPKGSRRTDLVASRYYSPALALDSQDRPVVVAFAGRLIQVQRFHSDDGTTDTSYAPTLIDVGDGRDVIPTAIALQPDRRAIVIGWTGDFALEHSWFVAMVAPEGGRDTSFGGDGIVIGTPRGPHGFAEALGLQPDGGILVAGTAEPGTSEDATVLVRYRGSRRECGDANGNTEVSVSDGVQVLRAAADLPSSCLPEFCDLDASGAVTVSDGVQTLRAAAELPANRHCPD